jgi:hypothetical protein
MFIFKRSPAGVFAGLLTALLIVAIASALGG